MRIDRRFVSGASAALTLAVVLFGAHVIAQQSSGAGAFTAEQAQAGRELYGRECASCHGPTLGGGGGPELSGASFMATYRGKPVSELFGYIESQMPPGGNQALTPENFAQITAFILQQNNVPAGGQPLRAESSSSDGAAYR